MRSKIVALSLAALALAVAAHADHSTGSDAAPAPPPPLYDGLGTYSHKVTTAVPQAQKYFDQGLNLCFGFNHDEAVRAFREAARLDPTCAMAWWGIAYASGPNINLPMDEDHNKIALDAASMAKSLASGVSPAEREYIATIVARYSADPKVTRGSLDSLYAKNMRALAKKYPKDPDATAFAAEAMLDLNPWNQWTLDGKPNPGTLDAIALIESVLKQWPDHPFANHIYIHAVEASPNPGRALASSARLEKLLPGQGHLVHMPAHIYARVGRYRDAVTRNEVAVAVDEKYIAEQKPTGFYPLMYYNHNIQFIWFCSMMEGHSAEALEAARKIKSHVPDEMIAQMPMVEMLPTYPIVTLARFGRWKEVLAEPMPPASQKYTTALYNYIRGLAALANDDFDAADAALKALTETARTLPGDMLISTNPANMLLRVAVQDLDGQMAARQKRTDDAVRLLKASIATEDSLHYDEPPTFPWSIRPRLGQVLLTAGRASEAETAYREDLRRHPENGWALRGLADALKAQKKDSDAMAVERRFDKAWEKADVKLTAAAP